MCDKNKESTEIKNDDDQLHNAMGVWGSYQRRQICSIGVFCIPTCWHILIMTFMNAEVGSWCARPANLGDMSVTRWLEISGQENDTCTTIAADWEVWEESEDHKEEFDRVECEEWEFDKTQFSSTITSEFGLVRSKEYLKSMAQTIYFVGMICGVFTFGVLADYLGSHAILPTVYIWQIS